MCTCALYWLYKLNKSSSMASYFSVTFTTCTHLLLVHAAYIALPKTEHTHAFSMCQRFQITKKPNNKKNINDECVRNGSCVSVANYNVADRVYAHNPSDIVLERRCKVQRFFQRYTWILQWRCFITPIISRFYVLIQMPIPSLNIIAGLFLFYVCQRCTQH